MRYTTIGLLVGFIHALSGCSAYQGFTPTGTAKFDAKPADTVIPLLETAPDRPHEVIGYAETYAVSTDEALPKLQQEARKAGGDALLNLTSQQRYGLTSSYRAAVIRYIETSPSS